PNFDKKGHSIVIINGVKFLTKSRKYTIIDPNFDKSHRIVHRKVCLIDSVSVQILQSHSIVCRQILTKTANMYVVQILTKSHSLVCRPNFDKKVIYVVHYNYIILLYVIVINSIMFFFKFHLKSLINIKVILTEMFIYTTCVGNWRLKNLPVMFSVVWSSSEAPPAPSPQTTDSSTQTSQPTLAAHSQGQVTLRRSNNDGRNPRRPRPSSMVDYQSYRHTQELVRKILEQPATQGLAPEVQELVESIRHVLQSDQEHMEEAVRCASYIEQVFTDSRMGPAQPKPAQQQQPASTSCQTFPHHRRRRPGLLHLQSCGDLSSFTCAALESLEHRRNSRRAESRASSRSTSRTGSRPDLPDRPHSLIGVFRETVL
ncbi:hypothetical protein JOB18_023189, partial [Solea senegalensis]